MSSENASGWFATSMVWLWIGGAYFACLAPVWAGGVTWGSVGEVLVLGILVTYVLTLVHHDLNVLARRITKLLETWKP